MAKRKVYCEECGHFYFPNKIKCCINPISEIKQFDNEPINRFNTDFYFNPDLKNQNNDCKDYVEKREEPNDKN